MELVERRVRGRGAGGVAQVGVPPERCPRQQPDEALRQLQAAGARRIGAVRRPPDRRVEAVPAPREHAEELDRAAHDAGFRVRLIVVRGDGDADDFRGHG